MFFTALACCRGKRAVRSVHGAWMLRCKHCNGEPAPNKAGRISVPVSVDAVRAVAGGSATQSQTELELSACAEFANVEGRLGCHAGGKAEL